MNDNNIVIVNDDILRTLSVELVGRRIVSVKGDTLTLDNGVTLTMYMSKKDCCATADGLWEIIDPDDIQAIITKVSIDNIAYEYDGDGHTSSATISIYHNQNLLATGECSANDGNGGYYYSVLSLKVTLPNGTERSTEIISA